MERKKGTGFLLLILLVFATTSTPQPTASDSCTTKPYRNILSFPANSWSSFRGDPQNTGYTTASQAPKEIMQEIIWSKPGDSSIDCAVVGEGGKIYVGYFDKKLLCLDGESGKELWALRTDGGIVCSPTIFMGKLYFSTWQKTFYCVDAKTGKEEWERKAEITTPVICSRDLLFYGTSGGKIICESIISKKTIWTFETGQTIAFACPTIFEGKMCLGDWGGTLHCLDQKTGRETWSFKADGAIKSAAAFSNNSLYFGSTDGTFCCLDSETGKTNWSFDSGSPVESSPAVGAGRIVFASYYNIYCLNEQTGTPSWSFKPKFRAISSPIIAGDKVYQATLCQSLHCFDLEKGTEFWHYEDLIIHSSPSCMSGMIYIGNDHGTLYCFGDTKAGGKQEPLFSIEPAEIVFERPGTEKQLKVINLSEDYLSLNAKTGEAWIKLSKTVFELAPQKTAYIMVSVARELEADEEMAGSITIGNEVWEEIARVIVKKKNTEDSCQWQMFRGGPERTGHPDGECGPGDPSSMEVLWSFQAWQGAVESSPAIWNNSVYFGSYNNNFYRVDIDTGELKWRYECKDGVYSSPAIDDGKVYFGSFDGYFRCLDCNDGKEVFRFKTGDRIHSSPLVSSGKVIFGSNDGKVYCLDSKTGDQIWIFEANTPIQSSPALKNGRIFIGGLNGRMYCLDFETGNIIWEYNAGGSITCVPALAYDRVYFGTWARKFCCLAQEDGKLQWSFDTKEYIESSAACSSGRVYFGANDNYLHCLDGLTGDEIWTFRSQDRKVTSSPAIDSSEKIYVGT
ncbi:MAG: PQQ-binding-like beta-propeller repeat protein [Caldisericia bacterium]|nr:PQQ-binding-like beta-propeller repeat protein [Caldisericia bacterium]